MKKIIFAFATFSSLLTPLSAQIKLPRLISNGMVLQRDTDLKIWGWASPNEPIKLHFNAKDYSTKANATGNWEIILPKQKAGGPYQMELEASNKITISDILFGDVWICAGQSNMELPMERVKEKYSKEIAQATNSKIRQFLVPDKYDFKKECTDFDGGNWVACDPKTVMDFTAVGYFFAKAITEKYPVPIGLINTALGGSPVESWMSEKALTAFPKALLEAEKFKNDALIEQITKSDQKRSDDWYASLNSKDSGLQNNKPIWLTSLPNEGNEMMVPGYWADQTKLGNVNGVVWFQKEINVPKSMAGKPAKLFLGRLVDQDYVYVNETYIGTTGYQYPPRRYEVPQNVLKEGKNTITIRLVNNSGKGGFVLDKPYFLAVGDESIDLKGKWKFRLGTEMPALEGPTFIRWKPEGLYNAMIAPLLNYKIKGTIWYQGESNTGNPSEYNAAFSTMITDWRTNWKQGNFPFLFVQLTNFMEAKPEPTESNWAALREAQGQTLSVPNTGMIVTIDIGEWNDIHPLNKEAVGNRLALQARKLAYGESNLVAASPSPQKTTFETDKVVIDFKDAGKGLKISKGNEVKEMAISNDGKRFVWAKVKVAKNQITIWYPEIKNPTVVRYAWANNPDQANLFSSEGLPVTPFEVVKGK